MINPLVFTSKKAQEFVEDVKTKHADIVTGLQDQAMRLADISARKEAERLTNDKEEKTRGFEREKLQMTDNIKRMELDNKKRELEIKAQALTETD